MRTKKGIVTSAKMTGTVAVIVHRAVFHPIYKKRFRRSKKFLADREGIEDLQEGDTVVITECRPLSKNKCFKVTEVVERVPRVSEIKEEEGIEEAVHGSQEEEAGRETEDVGRSALDGKDELDTRAPKSEVLSPKSEPQDASDSSDKSDS